MVIVYLIDIALVMNTIMIYEIEDLIYSGFWFNLIIMMINNLTEFHLVFFILKNGVNMIWKLIF